MSQPPLKLWIAVTIFVVSVSIVLLLSTDARSQATPQDMPGQPAHEHSPTPATF